MATGNAAIDRVIEAINFESLTESEKNTLTGWIIALYGADGTGTGWGVVKTLAEGTGLNFARGSANSPYYDPASNTIFVNFVTIDQLYGLTTQGVYRKMSPVLMLVHEMGHALDGATGHAYDDPSSPNPLSVHQNAPNFDTYGGAVVLEHKVADELGLSAFKRAGYFAAWHSSDLRHAWFEVGRDYTPNDIEVFRMSDFLPGTFGTNVFATTTDTRSPFGGSPGLRDDDLFIGLEERDTVKLGGGNDVAWGGDGDDLFDGGDGNDVLSGEEGEDTFIGGQGNDTLNGGHARGLNAILGDLQIDTVDYSGLGAEVRFRLGGADSTKSRPGFVQVLKNKGEFGTDAVSEVEKFVGTAFADSLILDGGTNFTAFSNGKAFFDLGSHNSSGIVGDTIHAAEFSRSLTFDLRVRGAQFIRDSQSGESISLSGADAVVGTAFGDTIFGNGSGNALVGGGGSDHIFGGSGNDRLVGGYSDGQGNYSDDGKQDFITSGGGIDKIYFSNQDKIVDANILNRASQLYYANGAPRAARMALTSAVLPVDGVDGTAHLLIGGENESPPANPCNIPTGVSTSAQDGEYVGADGAKYTLSAGALTIEYNGGTVYLDNFRNGNGGINLRETRPNVATATCKRDPLIIDLDGDRNVVRELFDSTAYFDLDNDGFRERVAWSLGGDGFLVRDLNGNGSIDNGTELFGTGRVEQVAGTYQRTGKEGFADLAALDSNADGRIDAADADFATLKVWVDANGDAVTDEGELKTLTELGIQSISLTTTASDDLDCGCDGTQVTFKSDVTMSDGSTRSAYDAYLAIDQYDTREVETGVSVPTDFADLPFLIGSGNLSHLDVAMARDPALEAMVREFAALDATHVGEITERVEAILLRWTGADQIAADSRGANINARWLTAIEKISGSEFVQARIGANPRGDAGSILINEWHAIVGRTTAALLGQTALGQELMPGLSFEAAAFFTASDGTTLQSVLASLASHAPAARQDALEYWQAAARTLSHYDQQLGFTKADLAAALTPLLQASNVPLTGEQLLDARYTGAASGMDYSAQLSSTQAQQFHVVGDGTERLVGSGAQDIYLIGAGVGSVSLAAQANSSDELWLIDTLRGDLATKVSVSASNTAVDAEFLLSLSTAVGDTISLTSNLSTSGFNTPVRMIQFADGERVSVSDLLANQILAFGASGQVQFGKADSSVDLAGTASADLLVGFGLNDRYLVGPGRGSDYIRDVSSSLHDRAVVSTTLSDVRFAASGISGRDLTMTFLSTGEKVTVVGQLGAPGSEVDYFEFSNGLTLTAADVRAMVTTGTPGNDRLVGTVLDDVLDGKGGTDLVLGGRGDDEYRFNLGYGQLSIDDTGAGNSIRFGSGITPASLILTGDGSDLLISVSGTQDSIRLLNARYGESIGQLFFADNTSTTLATLVSQAAAQAGTAANGTITGTEAAEDITGTSGNDRILGLGGTLNYLYGLAGNDTYVFGGGQDVIAESLSGFDTLEIPAGFKLEDMRMMRTGSSGTLKIWFENSDGGITLWNGFTLTGQPDTSVADDVERIVFADGRFIDLTQGEKTAGTAGNDYLYSFRPSNAIITPGAGNDIVNLSLLSSNNVVRYTSNDIGNDIIRLPEISEGAGTLTNSFSLQLQATPFDATVKLGRTGVDLVVSFTNRSDSITVKDYFNPLQRDAFFHLNTMGGIAFSNASFTYATLSAAIAQKTAGDDVLFGRANLDGGAGNDVLIGDDLANNYTFGRGYGHDVIKEQDGITGIFSSNDTAASTGDTLTMTGLNKNDVEFFRSPIDPLSIVIRIKDTGETLTLDGTPFDDLAKLQEIQQLTLANDVQDQNGAHRIERIIFQDGELSQLDIEQIVTDAERTSGNDLITNFGTYLPYLSSLTQMQSAVYDGGSGDDTYANPFDRMSLRMSATSGNDVVRNSGEGLTTIKLALGDLNLADIYTRSEVRDGVAYLTVYSKTGSSLAIEVPRGYATTSSDAGLRVFVTDQTGATANLRPNAVGNYTTATTSTTGTAGVDSLWGSSSADTFVSGAGNDVIFGQSGNDVVEFRFGDGADNLVGNRATTSIPPPPALPIPTTSGGYRIAFKGAITPNDISYQWQDDDSGNVRIVVGSQGDSLTVRYDSLVNMSFESTGTTITPVWANLVPAATTGNDNLRLLPGATINGLAGDDTITSIGSNGTIRFGVGSGHDVFSSQINGWVQSPTYNSSNFNSQAGASYSHTVVFDGINSLSELAFEKSGENLGDLTIRIIATGETLTIRDQLSESSVPIGTTSNGNYFYQAVVGTFKLADGTTFSWQKIQSLIIGQEHPADATITTNSNGGTLDGGGGFDTLLGGTGSDTYVFGRGYDEDAIRDAGGEDVMTFGEGIARDELYFSRAGTNGQDLLVEVTGQDRLSATIAGQFSDDGQGRIEYFELSDGTLMSYREVERFILDTNSTSSADTILGFASDDRIDALGGNDAIQGLGGDDVIDGGTGRDQAIFRGKASEYQVTTVDGVTTVRDLVSGRDGTDTLRNVEDLVFLGDGGAIQSLVAPNHAPTASPTTVAGTEDVDSIILRSTLLALAGDVDGDSLTLSVGDGVHGKAWIGTDGNIRFRPDADFNGDASFRYTVADGNGGITSALVTLAITAVNDAPRIAVALEDVTVAEDQPVSIVVPGTAFADPDGQALSLTARLASGDALPAWLTFSNGTISGQPPANFNGTLEIELTASDGTASASDTFSLTIRPVNDAPVIVEAVADIAVVPGANVQIVIPATNYVDPEGDPLRIEVLQANGDLLPDWLTFAGGVLQGIAPAGFVESLSLVVRVDDGQSMVADYFDIIAASNSPPVLANPIADFAVPEDTAFSIIIPSDTFADADGDALTFNAKLANGDPLPSWLTLDGGTFNGTPPADYNGAFDVEVTASDGNATISDVFRLTVSPVNDPPVLIQNLAQISGVEDTPFAIALDKSKFVDPDGDNLVFAAVLTDGSPLPAWLQFDGTTFSGTPPQDFYGTIGLLITASDGTAQTSANLLLTIDPVNDAPVLIAALPDVSSPEDTALSFVLPSGSFSDVDNAALILSAVQSNGVPLPGWLSFDAATRTFSGTPPQDFNGFVDVRVTASDGELSASDDFRLTITPVNDAPVLLQPLAAITSLEDQALSAVLPQGAFGDVDGDTLSYSATLANGSPLPTWLHFAAGTFTGTPPSNFNGSLDLLVSASDAQLSTSAALRLTVTPVNDAPVLSIALPDHTVSAGTAIDWPIPAGSFSDVDGDRLTLTATLANGTALPNWLTFDGQHFAGTVPAGFTGILDVKVTASDGSLSVSDIFQIAAVSGNHAPDAVDDGLFVTDQAQQLVIAAADLLANDSDPDGDPLQIVSVQGASHGTVSIAQNGNIVYSADGAYVGTDSFTYTLSDGRAVDTATVAVRVDSPFATWSQGTAGNDKLFGNMAIANQINGLGGNDQIKGGQLDDWLAGGDGDDHLIGLGGNDHFWGGAGNDVLNGNAGTDVAHYFGLRSSYSVVTVNGAVTVVDNAPNVDGNDGIDTISSIEQLVFKNGETASVISPIILDLDGKGVRTLTSAQSRATYDLNGDGQRDDTSWIGGTEGFLFLDRDGNGTLSGANEMSFTDDVPGAASDLAGLRAFDSNGDGRLSADDAMFAQFKIWRDANGNGTVDRGEVLSLNDAGVRALNLTGTAVNAATAFGDVAVVARGSYERTDGTSMEFLDAALTYFSAASNPAPRRPLLNRGWKIGEPEPQIDVNPGLDDAITALSTQTGTNTIAALAGLSDAEAFARFASNQGEPASALADNQSVSVQHSQELPAMAVTADAIFLGEDNAASNGAMAATVTDSARLLALLRQDMAGFGASNAMDRISWKTDTLFHGGGLAYL